MFIPLTVGGGVRSSDDVRNLLLAGADKVSFNSAAVEPDVISEAANRFGLRIVCAIDAKASHLESGNFSLTEAENQRVLMHLNLPSSLKKKGLAKYYLLQWTKTGQNQASIWI